MTPTDTGKTATHICGRCGQAVWWNSQGTWSSDLPGSATTLCPDGIHVHTPYAANRPEHEPCQRGTVGCSINHITDSRCETW